MKCPKLPVHINEIPCFTEEEVAYIIHATNSHEKLLEDSQVPRCRCGGELEGLGRDIKTKDEVWECKECNAQIIIVHKEAEKPK